MVTFRHPYLFVNIVAIGPKHFIDKKQKFFFDLSPVARVIAGKIP
jgi:hypothetical protein